MYKLLFRDGLFVYTLYGFKKSIFDKIYLIENAVELNYENELEQKYLILELSKIHFTLDNLCLCVGKTSFVEKEFT